MSPPGGDSVPEPRVTVTPLAVRSGSSGVALRLSSSLYVLPLAENDWATVEAAGTAKVKSLVTVVVAVGTITRWGLEAALVPADVVSVAVYT